MIRVLGLLTDVIEFDPVADSKRSPLERVGGKPISVPEAKALVRFLGEQTKNSADFTSDMANILGDLADTAILERLKELQLSLVQPPPTVGDILMSALFVLNPIGEIAIAAFSYLRCAAVNRVLLAPAKASSKKVPSYDTSQRLADVALAEMRKTEGLAAALRNPSAQAQMLQHRMPAVAKVAAEQASVTKSLAKQTKQLTAVAKEQQRLTAELRLDLFERAGRLDEGIKDAKRLATRNTRIRSAATFAVAVSSLPPGTAKPQMHEPLVNFVKLWRGTWVENHREMRKLADFYIGLINSELDDADFVTATYGGWLNMSAASSIFRMFSMFASADAVKRADVMLEGKLYKAMWAHCLGVPPFSGASMNFAESADYARKANAARDALQARDLLLEIIARKALYRDGPLTVDDYVRRKLGPPITVTYYRNGEPRTMTDKKATRERLVRNLAETLVAELAKSAKQLIDTEAPILKALDTLKRTRGR
ncbi:MAG: hypothetical protein RMA76_06455 [Deltaproteobacteria bacterium]